MHSDGSKQPLFNRNEFHIPKCVPHSSTFKYLASISKQLSIDAGVQRRQVQWPIIIQLKMASQFFFFSFLRAGVAANEKKNIQLQSINAIIYSRNKHKTKNEQSIIVGVYNAATEIGVKFAH